MIQGGIPTTHVDIFLKGILQESVDNTGQDPVADDKTSNEDNNTKEDSASAAYLVEYKEM